MKTKLLSLSIVLSLSLVLSLSTGCGSLSDLVNDLGLIKVETVSGYVDLKNINDNSGVNISLNGKNQFTTDETGYFNISISNFSLSTFSIHSSSDNKLTFEKDGFENKYKDIPNQYKDSNYNINIELEKEIYTNNNKIVKAVDFDENYTIDQYLPLFRGENEFNNGRYPRYNKYTNNSVCVFKWEHFPMVVEYNIYRSQINYNIGFVLVYSTKTENRWVDQMFQDGIVYYYRLGVILKDGSEKLYPSIRK